MPPWRSFISLGRRSAIGGAVSASLMWFFGQAAPRRSQALADEASKPRSAAFERFRFSFFEDPTSAQDQLDVASLLELRDDERALAEKMLQDFLPDTRAILGLGALRSRSAEPRLLEIFELERLRAKGVYATHDPDVTLLTLIWSAQALWRIDPGPVYAHEIIDNLRYSPNWTDRLESAMALAEMPTPEVDAALRGCLDDPEALVRYHVARALLIIHGQPAPVIADPASPLARIGSSDAARRETGRRDILAAIANRPLVAKAGSD